jgi:hypothetical protein
VSISLSDVRACYRAYLDLVERRKIASPMPFSLYESIYKLIPTGFVDFLLAKIDGQIVGGMISFFYGPCANAFQSICFSQYLRSNAVNLLWCTAIEHAIETGCKHFDFGESLGQEGLQFFKEQFGATSKALGRVDVYLPGMRPAVILYTKARELAGKAREACAHATRKATNEDWQRH